ncbi:hypothetical protein INR49_028148 [Caranx melampygus]|nr:hypothetical protein INR49_028148 [Caranx melampygus]
MNRTVDGDRCCLGFVQLLKVSWSKATGFRCNSSHRAEELVFILSQITIYTFVRMNIKRRRLMNTASFSQRSSGRSNLHRRHLHFINVLLEVTLMEQHQTSASAGDGEDDTHTHTHTNTHAAVNGSLLSAV